MSRRRRTHRRGERGSAVAFVAVGATALIAVTGLAIDGGMAAGAYRHAQNAADAGALAAARQQYLNAWSVPPVNSTASSLTPTAQREVTHNGSQLTSVTAGSFNDSGSTGGTVWMPMDGSVNSAEAAFAEVATTVTSPLGTLFDADAILNRAYGAIQGDTTSGVQHGSTASAETEWLYFNSQTLNQTDRVNCQSASASYHATGNTTGPFTDCSNPTLPAPVTTATTLVANANPDAEVSTVNGPSSRPSINVASTAFNTVAPNLPISASAIHSSDNVAWDALTGAAVTTASVSATNVNLQTSPLNLTASALSMSVSISMGPKDSQPHITPSCAPATVNFSGGLLGASWTGSVASDCSVVNMTSQVATVTITGDWSSPSTNQCSYNNLTKAWGCSLQTCLLRIVETTTAATICILKTNLGFSVKAMTIPTTGSGVIPAFVGPVTVTANLPQTTYFMRVLGWNQTDPSASSTAAVASVVDESQASFNASPFGIPDAGTSMGGPTGAPSICSLYLLTTLQPGCYYYLSGSSMSTYNPSTLGSSWTGQLDTGKSGHRVGTTVVASATQTPSVPSYFGSSSYYLEPVFDPSSLTVLYYAVFLPVANHTNWGLLVNSIPALNGPIVFSADTGSGWTPLNPGAVSIKVTQ